MKLAVEIDDALFREVKASSESTGRTMKDLVSDGLTQVLSTPALQEGSGNGGDTAALAELRRWFEATELAMRNAPNGASSRELLEGDRR